MPVTQREAVSTIEDALVRIVRVSHRPTAQDRLIADAGVNVDRSTYGLLRSVVEHGPLRLTSLAQVLGLDVSTVSRQVGALERQGLLGRSSDPKDGRASVLEVTPLGSDALDRLVDARHRMFDSVLSGWSEAEIATLAPMLSRLAADLEQDVGPR